VLAAHGIDEAHCRDAWPLRRARLVLRCVDVTLHSGEVVGLVDENGRGKSTVPVARSEYHDAVAAELGTIMAAEAAMR